MRDYDLRKKVYADLRKYTELEQAEELKSKYRPAPAPKAPAAPPASPPAEADPFAELTDDDLNALLSDE
jgi:hypothetical protein